jgi:colanic acid/amylovoran biosynthesis glycosyltransferase
MEPSGHCAERLRIGYLVPEFPAQSHTFFWREISALRELGIDAVLISTRRPPAGSISHLWAESAMRNTHYLLSTNWSGWLSALLLLLKRSPSRFRPLIASLGDQEYVAPGARFKLMAATFVAARLAHFAQGHQLDHIHVGSCGRSAEVAALGSILGDFTYSLSMLGPTFETYGQQHRLKWRKAAFGLFQSKKLEEQGRKVLGPDFPQRFAHAPVGVDTNRMVRSATYQPWTRGNTCHLYSCGRLDPVKGHEDVIDAVCILRARGIDAVLTIGGEDNHGGSGYRINVENHIATRDASRFVHLLGAVSEETNMHQYQTAHVYVMGSHDEAAGAVAAMEAMSMSAPVVMTRAGATEELISDGIDGLLTAPRHPEQIADAIQKVLLDPDLAERIRNEGRKKIQAHYSHFVSARAIHAFLTDHQEAG